MDNYAEYVVENGTICVNRIFAKKGTIHDLVLDSVSKSASKKSILTVFPHDAIIHDGFEKRHRPEKEAI